MTTKTIFDVIDKMAELEEKHEDYGDMWDKLSDWISDEASK